MNLIIDTKLINIHSPIIQCVSTRQNVLYMDKSHFHFCWLSTTYIVA